MTHTDQASRPIGRVLMTADPLGGVWTYALELTRELNRRGVDVILATMGGRLTESQHHELHALPAVTLHESPFKLEWMNDPWDDVDAAGEWLIDLERTSRPDIVHLSSMSHGALRWRAPSVVVAHSCVLSWWEAVRGTAVPTALDEYRRRIGDGLACATLVVAPTAAMLDAVERIYGSLPNRAVVWNGRSAETFAPRAKEPIVLGAGRVWDEAKNLAALDHVASALPWRVQIAGDTSAPDGTTTALQHAEWLGVLSADGIRAALARASIYALPARYEPFGLSAVEAALSGCALVLGDLRSLRELWQDAAVFVPPDDLGALEHALRRLIDDPAARAALAESAAARARRWTPAAMTSAYLAHYQAARAAMVA